MITHIYRFCAAFLPIALEGLPVSSSGHVLIITTLLVRWFHAVPIATMSHELDHIVHGPIALLIALFFYPRVHLMLKNMHRLVPLFGKVLLLGFITETMTGVWYGVWSLLGTSWFPLSLGCAVTACMLFSLRYCPKHKNGKWTFFTALFLGAVQGLALLPGISRFGATYTAARWCGMRSQKAFELSFLIEWPISILGFAKGLYGLRYASGVLGNFDVIGMLFGVVVGLIGFWCIQPLVIRNRVWYIGWYMAFMSIGTLVLRV